MRPTIYILCSTHTEAEQIATAHKLGNNWRWISGPTMLRGLNKPNVYRTPCWFYGRQIDVKEMWDTLQACGAVLTKVRCTAHSPARYAEDAA